MRKRTRGFIKTEMIFVSVGFTSPHTDWPETSTSPSCHPNVQNNDQTCINVNTNFQDKCILFSLGFLTCFNHFPHYFFFFFNLTVFPVISVNFFKFKNCIFIFFLTWIMCQSYTVAVLVIHFADISTLKMKSLSSQAFWSEISHFLVFFTPQLQSRI